jgi:hypothetical protein
MKVLSLLKILWHKWFYAWFELLLYFPLPLAVGAMLFPRGNPYLLLASIPFVYLASILCYGLLNVQRTALHMIAAAVVGGAIVTWSVGWHGQAGFILLGIYIVCWFRGIACANTDWERPLPDLHYVIGFFLYFIAWFVFRNYLILHHYQFLLTPAGLLAIIVAFFYLNYVHLREITLSPSDKPSLSAPILRMNRMLTAVIVGLIVILAGISYIRDGIAWVFSTIYGALLALYYWFLSLGSEDGVTPQGMDAGQEPRLEQGTTSDFWLLLEKIVFYIAYVATAILLIGFAAAIVYKLIQLLIRLIRNVIGRQDDRLRDAVPVGGYRDERESLARFGHWGADYALRLRHWIAALLAKEPGWHELPDATAKARYLYRHWVLGHMRRGYRFKRHLTPSETGGELMRRDAADADAAGRFPADAVVELYNEARYADRLSDPDAPERVRAQLQRGNGAGPGGSGENGA